MCGRMNVTDDPFLRGLLDSIGVSSGQVIASPDIAPGAKLSIIRQAGGQRLVTDASWWLLLDQQTLKPNYRYTSFNSRYDKLNTPQSISFTSYRQGRCIVPASGFVEGLGDKKTYFQIEPIDSAIAFGGLYKEWLNNSTGELIYSASIITLPPHPKLKHIHPKSTPLMLPYTDKQTIDMWLNPEFTQVEAFQDLLHPTLHADLSVTQIDKPSKRNIIAERFVIAAD
ncbi:SOS response-associated peptidase family protein [Alkalimarinus sediminis]|uniref:Abasic site processing protein n=1 Tax=Alkalimarinus sediminis TaxID=1632866 RepID=A0A9E8HFQ9_9ALTE|nr:SOS response-associated peptidase family protein [Alkalimarinus sediminis]UZW73800.1 SOS response-associated peptidase [Alkalimarinus sediminis]